MIRFRSAQAQGVKLQTPTAAGCFNAVLCCQQRLQRYNGLVDVKFAGHTKDHTSLGIDDTAEALPQTG